MSAIHYNLVNSANCTGMAPPPLAAGGFGAALLPPGMAIAGTMGLIGVTWGVTAHQNTGAGAWIVTNPAPPAAFVAVIDGVGVNLEQLLIRYCVTQLGAGGTVSNNVLAFAPYANPTANAVTVRLSWGNMGGLFAAGWHQTVWGVGAGF